MSNVTPDRYREVMGHVPTSVVAVTAMGPNGPAALAIGSFVSISLDPLLVGFFPAKSSSSWPIIRDVGQFCINVLADDQVMLSQRFATRGGNKFEGVGWQPSGSGAPILDGSVVWIDCEYGGEIDMGDHVLALGKVIELEVARDAHALVFHRGDYTSTAAAALADGEG